MKHFARLGMILFIGVMVAIMVMPMAASAYDQQDFYSGAEGQYKRSGDEVEPWRGTLLRTAFVYNKSWTGTNWTPEWLWVYNELWHGKEGYSPRYMVDWDETYDNTGKHKVTADNQVNHGSDEYFQTYGYHEVADPDSATYFDWDRWSLLTWVPDYN